MGNMPLGAAPGQQKTRVNSCRHQTVHRGKVRPGVSESFGSEILCAKCFKKSGTIL